MTAHPMNPQDSFHLFEELWLKHLAIHETISSPQHHTQPSQHKNKQYKPLYLSSLNRTRTDCYFWVSHTNLVAVDTHVMTGDECLEDDHPAGIGGSLKQRVSHLRDVHVGGIGG